MNDNVLRLACVNVRIDRSNAADRRVCRVARGGSAYSNVYANDGSTRYHREWLHHIDGVAVVGVGVSFSPFGCRR